MKLRWAKHLSNDFLTHSVMEEFVLYLFTEEAEFLTESMQEDMENYGVSGIDTWQDWIFDLFDGMDIVTSLYFDSFLSDDHSYHFDHWTDSVFYQT